MDFRYFLNQYCILSWPWPLLRTSDDLENTPPSDVREDLRCLTPVLPSSAARAVLLSTAFGLIDPEATAILNHLLESSVPPKAGTGCMVGAQAAGKSQGSAGPGLYLYYMWHALYFFFYFYCILPYPALPCPHLLCAILPCAALEQLMALTCGLKNSGAKVKSTDSGVRQIWSHIYVIT